MKEEILDNFDVEEKFSISKFTRPAIYHSLAIITLLLGLVCLNLYLPNYYPEINDFEFWIFIPGLLIFVVVIGISISLANSFSKKDSNQFLKSLALAAGIGVIFFFSLFIYFLIMNSVIRQAKLVDINLFQILKATFLISIFSSLISLNRIQKVRKENRILSGIILILYFIALVYIAQ